MRFLPESEGNGILGDWDIGLFESLKIMKKNESAEKRNIRNGLNR